MKFTKVNGYPSHGLMGKRVHDKRPNDISKEKKNPNSQVIQKKN